VTRGDIFVISAPRAPEDDDLPGAPLPRGGSCPLRLLHHQGEKGGEVDGVDYYFVDEDKFVNMLNSNEFLETASVYGYRYGTSRLAVEAIVSNGMDAVLEIDVQGGASVKAALPEAVRIGILPPDWRRSGRG